MAPAQGVKRRRDECEDGDGDHDEVSDVDSLAPDSGDLHEVDELLSLHNSDDEVDPENETETEVIIANRQCNVNSTVNELIAHEYGELPCMNTPHQCLLS